MDTDTHTTSCRLAFHGQMRHALSAKDYMTADLPKFRIYKTKSKEGVVERMGSSDFEVICKGMFKKETDLASLFSGLKVSLSTGEQGKIEDTFGQSGKFKVSISGGEREQMTVLLYYYIQKCFSLLADGLQETTKASLGKKKKKEKASPGESEKPVTVHLEFKRYIFSKKMTQ